MVGDEDETVVRKLPQKLRAPNSYILVKEFLKSYGMYSIYKFSICL